MIFLKKILSEALTQDIYTSPMYMVVIYDDTNGLKDEKKRNEIKRIILRNLNAKAASTSNIYDFSNVQKIIDNLKYYPATDKIIGKLPRFFFKIQNNPSIKSIKFSYELLKVSPSLQIKLKK